MGSNSLLLKLTPFLKGHEVQESKQVVTNIVAPVKVAKKSTVSIQFPSMSTPQPLYNTIAGI